jgi:hypothetical protein
MRGRQGFALLEVLVAAVLGTIVVALAVVLLQTQSILAREATMRSERNDAMRSTFAILSAELRNITPADVRAIARDSVVTRIFRGLAIICGFNRPDVFIRYHGLRLPDPAKDSALQVGPENVVALAPVRTDSSACPRNAGEQVLAINWAAEPRIGAAWLIFESGGYHLDTHALRYRQGGATRQPITNEVLDDRLSAFHPVADSVLRRIDVILRDRYVARVMQGRLALRNTR